MNTCPICTATLHSPLCPQCGYDRSQDYARYPTLGRLPAGIPAPSRRGTSQSGPAHPEALRCPDCGGYAFSLLTGRRALCLGCGSLRETDQLGVPQTPAERRQPRPAQRLPIVSRRLAAAETHTVLVRSDGTVLARGNPSGGKCATGSWFNIAAVSAGPHHTVGLKRDGTVVCAGQDTVGECRLEGWKDLVSVAAGTNHTVGLRADGTVIAAGSNSRGQCSVQSWKNVTAVAAGYSHTLGLRADGTVIAAGSDELDQCKVETWRDITAIAATTCFSLGLKRDGTVVITGGRSRRSLELETWRNITAIAACSTLILGLRADGTVAAYGNLPTDASGHGDPATWRNITAIALGPYHAVGLTRAGTLVSFGSNRHGQRNLQGIRLFPALEGADEQPSALRRTGRDLACTDPDGAQVLSAM